MSSQEEPKQMTLRLPELQTRALRFLAKRRASKPAVMAREAVYEYLYANVPWYREEIDEKIRKEIEQEEEES